MTSSVIACWRGLTTSVSLSSTSRRSRPTRRSIPFPGVIGRSQRDPTLPGSASLGGKFHRLGHREQLGDRVPVAECSGSLENAIERGRKLGLTDPVGIVDVELALPQLHFLRTHFDG